ncbi:MAG: ROK family protein, partial [Clostridia bacterium]|nr:ROK family protein [Clostridia bacterium]
MIEKNLKDGNSMYYLGIDLGGTNIAVGVVDENYKIIKKKSTPTLANRDGKLIIKDMANLCKAVVEECGLTIDDIEYAGIATPGTANSDTGVVEYANNLPFVNFPIADLLKEYLGVKKVYIENDANAAAKAEALAGAAKGA